MAVNFAENASGFRHTEVVSFINNEIFMNGGDLDFYTTFYSLSWNEIEDRLQAVLADPQVPCARKRACAWSALALSVRVGARQREQLLSQVQQLQQRVVELEGTACTLGPELQRLRQERGKMASRLRHTQVALQHALYQRDLLHGRLRHFERLIQITLLTRAMGSESQPDQLRATGWPLNEGWQRNVQATGMRVPPWAQAMQLRQPMPVPYPFPFHLPFPVRFPFSPPLRQLSAERVVMPPKKPPPGFYPLGQLAAVGDRKKMATLCNQGSHSQDEGLGSLDCALQGTVPIADIRSFSQKQDLEGSLEMVNLSNSKNHSQEDVVVVGPQEMVLLADSCSCSQKKQLEKPQGMVIMGDFRNNSQAEDPERSQAMLSQGASGSQGQEERPHGMILLEGSKNHYQEEDLEMSQGPVPLVDSRSPSQGEDPERLQVIPVKGSRGLGLKENPMKHLPQEQKANQPEGKRTTEFQHQEMPASHDSLQNWSCPFCKVLNYSWCKSCYKCGRFCKAVGRDQGRTYFRKVSKNGNTLKKNLFPKAPF
ncbi:testis-expressed protein 13D [Saccopteryx bilineata]|uniref:testis-expressed protein 13D n=1 Tax=Saccopteryx bilineata TaxID=59482 RepID=UPI00338E39D2